MLVSAVQQSQWQRHVTKQAAHHALPLNDCQHLHCRVVLTDLDQIIIMPCMPGTLPAAQPALDEAHSNSINLVTLLCPAMLQAWLEY